MSAVSLAEILKKPSGQWVSGEGPDADVVLSTRVRLARNLADVPFPSRMDRKASDRVVAMVEAALPALRREIDQTLELYRLEDLPPLERRVLVEKHLISPQHARAGRGAVVLSGDGAVSIMVNEEDHLRIQCLAPGFQLDAAWRMADRIDDVLEEQLNLAFCPRRGYLTSCPTNTGTGLRASVMAHLPGLVMANQAGALFSALLKVGVVVRGLYGEGTEAAGNIFQISNQITLGQAEAEILNNLRGVTQRVIDRERAARRQLYRDLRPRLEDRVWRAYGILTTARSLTSQEAMALLSDLRLGIDLQVIPQVEPRVFNQLLLAIGPAFLQIVEGREIPPEERDALRASLVRQRIKESEARRGG